MKVCKLCNIEKQLNEFYSYNSTKNKCIIYRNECISCFRHKNTESVRKHRLKKKLSQINPESQIEVFKEPVLELIEGITKQCVDCKKILPIDDYKNSKGNPIGNKCFTCYKKYLREYDKQKAREKGWGEEYYKEPGNWYSDEQKEAVSAILFSLGWKLNNKNNIFYKKGIKNSEGIFMNLKTFDKTKRIYQKKFPDRKSKLDKLRTPETINEMIRMRNEGYVYPDIAERFGISKTTVRQWISKSK